MSTNPKVGDSSSSKGRRPDTGAESHHPQLLWFAPGVIAYTVALGALSWDGAFYLFRILHEETLPVFHGRYTAALFTGPTWLAHRFTDDLGVIRFIFSASYASLPLIALALTAWIDRHSTRAMLPWAALSLGFVTASMQFFAVSEAMIASQLAWPLLAATLAPPNSFTRAAAVVLALAIAFLHPGSALLLGAVALCGLVAAWRGGSRRYASSVIVLVIALVRLAIPMSPYDRSMASTESMVPALLRATFSLPALAMILALVAGLVILVAGDRNDDRRRARLVPKALLMAAGVALVAWSTTDNSWRELIGYRLFVPFATVPFLLLATAYSLQARPRQNWSRFLTTTAGVVFSLVLISQSWTWNKSLDEFQANLAAAPQRCVAEPAANTSSGAIFSFWTIAPLSIVIGDRTVDRVVFNDWKCDDWLNAGLLRIATTNEPAGPGWFRY